MPVYDLRQLFTAPLEAEYIVARTSLSWRATRRRVGVVRQYLWVFDGS